MALLTRERPIAAARVEAHPALIDTLARAFVGDPAVSWIMPDLARQAQVLPGMFKHIVPFDHRLGMALTSPGHEVVTLWRAPGRAHGDWRETLAAFAAMPRVFGRATLRAHTVASAVEAHLPSGFDYWYLHYAGVAPEHQARGWGGAAIRAGLEIARAAGLPVHLETATPANVGLYQRLGFAITNEWDVPHGGPHFWSMLWRG